MLVGWTKQNDAWWVTLNSKNPIDKILCNPNRRLHFLVLTSSQTSICRFYSICIFFLFRLWASHRMPVHENSCIVTLNNKERSKNQVRIFGFRQLLVLTVKWKSRWLVETNKLLAFIDALFFDKLLYGLDRSIWVMVVEVVAGVFHWLLHFYLVWV